VEVPEGEREKQFDEFPDESMADWHRRHGVDTD
jgi:hypothetical protein